MKKRLVSLIAYLVLVLTGVNAWATPFNSLYAFGDSLSDGGSNPSAVLSIFKLLGGNCDPGHPCPPYVDGHFSNGNVAVEYLADSILPGGASTANFYDFAVAGATTGIGNFGDGGHTTSPGVFGLPGMSQEIGLYLSTSGGVADPNALYFVWGGANDFLTQDSPLLAAQNIAGYVAALASAGAEHIFVPNLPDLSLTPFVKTEGLGPLAQAFSMGFDTELATQLGNLSSQFPTTDIIQFDAFSLLNNMILNPATYGFTNTQDACLSSLLVVCANPDNYIFWDSFHPTTKTHAEFATAFANAIAIPVPGTIALLVTGLFVLSAVGRIRNRGPVENINRVRPD